MTVGFNPMVSNNRQQKTSFKALPVDKITKNAPEARMFRMDVVKGKIPKTEENIKDLFTAITKVKDIEAKSYLEEIRDEIWKVKQ